MPRKNKNALSYGPVLVTKGIHKGRIGYYDDMDYNGQRRCEEAIVYFGDMLIACKYHIIPFDYLSDVTTDALIKRKNILIQKLSPFSRSALKGDKRSIALEELNYIDDVLGDRMFSARLTKPKKGSQVFISHSSKDKQFARWIAIDLKNAGHHIWFDEWDIKVGQSIPREIGRGLDKGDFVAVVLSSHSVESRWVENEWHTKYWHEIERNNISVLPLLKEDCAIPTLLKTKKYADFRQDYTQGLEDLLFALAHLSK